MNEKLEGYMRKDETTRNQLKEVDRSVKASKKAKEEKKKEMKRNMLGL